MTHPILTVEGKELEVINASFRNNVPYTATVINEEGNVVCYHDVTYAPSTVMQSIAINLPAAFGYKYDHVELIRKRIEAHEERMIELAFDYIQHDEPFADKVEVQKEWHRLNEQVHGLYQAIELVEGKHEPGTMERFAQGVVQAAVTLAKGCEW